MTAPLLRAHRRALRPLDLATMTPAQCEATQRALLYPWERARFDDAEVIFLEKERNESDRACLYVLLDQRLDDAMEEACAQGKDGWWNA